MKAYLIAGLFAFFTASLFGQDSQNAQQSGFPLPELEIITTDNLDRLEQIATIGNGAVLDVDWSATRLAILDADEVLVFDLEAVMHFRVLK